MAPSASSLQQVSGLTAAAGLGALAGFFYARRLQQQAIEASEAAREAPARDKQLPNREAPQSKPAAKGATSSTAKGSSAKADVPPRVEPQAPQGRRDVICCEALEWLRKPGSVPQNAFVFTSLPDVSEVKEFAPTLEAWEAWFMDAVKCVLQALPPGGLAVFYQTDIRLASVGQVSKAFHVMKAAKDLGGCSMRWHKVVHFENVDQPSHHSTTVKFTHLLCFQRDGAAGESNTADTFGGTLPEVIGRGEKPWGLKNAARCMGSGVTQVVLKAVCRWLPKVDTVVDPFCGAGTVLAVANTLGLHAIGVDISNRRCRQAKALDGVTLLAGRAADTKRQKYKAGSKSEDEDEA